MTRQRRNPIDDSQEPDDLFRLDQVQARAARKWRVRRTALPSTCFPLAPNPYLRTAPLNSTQRRRPIPRARPWAMGEVLCGRYVIESQLASGSMGTVYKALDRSRSEHTEADAYVAIKVLHEKTADAFGRAGQTAP